jgi:hypothetical protein
MTVTEFIAASYLLSTGKVAALTSDSTKYQKLLAFANFFSRRWANESGIDWNSRRELVDLGTVSATDTYDLDSAIGKLSPQEDDYVRIQTSDGLQEYQYTIVPISELYDSRKLLHPDNFKCAISGQSIVFAHSFLTTDPQYGGTITVPAYTVPDTLTSATQSIQVDDPDWLVAMAAAEYVRTDITRRDQYPNLLAMATESMQGMKERNGSQLERISTPWTPGVSSNHGWE